MGIDSTTSFLLAKRDFAENHSKIWGYNREKNPILTAKNIF